VRFDGCPACLQVITSFVRPVGKITCHHCKVHLKFVVVPPEGNYGAYRALVKVP
jgi:hypothetical protein